MSNGRESAIVRRPGEIAPVVVPEAHDLAVVAPIVVPEAHDLAVVAPIVVPEASIFAVRCEAPIVAVV